MPHRGSAPVQLLNRKAVGYVRVSTETQVTEGVSIDAQTQRLQAYCTAAGLDLVRIIRDEAVSGSILLGDRLGGAELLALLDEEGVAHIVALKLDRLFRDAADALNQSRSWDRAGVSLHVLDMGGQAVNTASAMGRMFLTMTAAFAELERNLIAERTRAALHHKRNRGEAVGRAPRGLRITGGRLEPDPSSDGLRLVARARDLRDQA